MTHAFNTPAMVECLSKLPNLRNLTIGQCLTEERKLESSELCGDRVNSAGFPSLRSVSFDEDPEPFHDTFLKPYCLASLTVLSIDYGFRHDDVHTFVSYIVTTCPRIKSLAFGLESYGQDETKVRPGVPWSFIEPLSCCKELTSLLLYSMHVSVHSNELIEFIKSRKTWTRLHILTSDPLRLQDMLFYAEHCPNLEQLGIHVASPDGFRVQDLPSLGHPTFSNLSIIYFARNTITVSTSHIVAQFLFHICKQPSYEIEGLHYQVIDEILKWLTRIYIEERRRTGIHMSSQVKTLVKEMIKKFGKNLDRRV